MDPITWNSKRKVSRAIMALGNQWQKKISDTMYRDHVPAHVEKNGRIIDKVLEAPRSMEDLKTWCEENLPNGAPIGGGSFAVHQNAIFNDDTEGGYEVSIGIYPTMEGITIRSILNQNEMREKTFAYPIKASDLLKVIVPNILEELAAKENELPEPTTPEEFISQNEKVIEARMEAMAAFHSETFDEHELIKKTEACMQKNITKKLPEIVDAWLEEIKNAKIVDLLQLLKSSKAGETERYLNDLCGWDGLKNLKTPKGTNLGEITVDEYLKKNPEMLDDLGGSLDGTRRPEEKKRKMLKALRIKEEQVHQIC